MRSFGWKSTTDDVIEGVSLAGKTAIITGATTGLGFETARALAQVGAHVVILGRNLEKLNAAGDRLRVMELSGSVETAALDLVDLDNVRRSALRLLKQHPKVNILVNNAGVMACPPAKTKQGFEMQFGTNHLGHFLFTCLLGQILIAGAPSRVVNLSSGGHRRSDINLDDPNFKHTEYERWQAYGASKTANILFTVGLDARLKTYGVRSYAINPGVIETPLYRHLAEEDIDCIRTMYSGRMKTVAQGAATSVWAATAPELADRGGTYLEDCHIAELAADTSVLHGVQGYALDPSRADQLWKISEQLVGEKFSW